MPTTPTSTPLTLWLHGYGGKMCVRIAELALEAGDKIAGASALLPLSASFPLYTDIEKAPPQTGLVFIDFTNPKGFRCGLAKALEWGVPFVSGTTGLDEADHLALARAAEKIPVFYSRNMSLGVALLRSLVALVAKSLPSADAEILDIHHSAKLDSPSGTALMLAESIASARGEGFETIRIHRKGARRAGEIGVTSLRMGEAVGEHDIHFSLAGEMLTLKHQALSRDVLVNGALRAARFLKDAKKGLYDMHHLLK